MISHTSELGHEGGAMADRREPSAQPCAALDREQPVQFVTMGTSLAAAPGQ